MASQVAEIQQCIDSLDGVGGTVLIKSGQYVLTEHVHIPTSGIHLVGEGAGATTLKVGDDVRQAGIIVGTLKAGDLGGEERVSDVSISRLSIDGNKAGNRCFETEADAPHLTLNGISVYYARDVTISDVKIERARSGGITTDREVHNLVVSRVTIRESFWDGVALYRTEASRVENSLIEENSAAAISMDWSANDNSFSDNLFLNNATGEALNTEDCEKSAKPMTGPGVFLAGVSRNLFANNVIVGHSDNGVQIKEGSANPPPGSARNYFLGNTIAENVNHGVWVTPQCVDCVGNVGLGTRYYGNTLVDLNVSVPIPAGGSASDYYRDVDPQCDAGACPSASFGGATISDWELALGDGNIPSTATHTEADHTASHEGGVSTITANARKRPEAGLHGIWLSRRETDLALTSRMTFSIEFRLPDAVSIEAHQAQKPTGQTIDFTIFSWDGKGMPQASRRDYGFAISIMTTPYYKTGVVRYWVTDSAGVGSWMDTDVTLDLDTEWHTVELSVDPAGGSGVASIDGAIVVAAPRAAEDKSQSGFGNDVTARVSVEVVSVDPGESREGGRSASLEVRNWSWVWSPGG